MTITSGSGELSAPGVTERFAARFASWRSRRFDDGPHMSLVASLPRLATNTAAGDPKKYSFYTPQLNLLSETDYTAAATPAIANDYIWFNGQPVAQVDVATSTPHWTFTDHLGTPLIQTDTAGSIDWRAEQEPYGTVYALRVGTTRHQPLRFPGQEYDELTADREYNVFRWYREGWGRYTQGDPVGLSAGLNLYSYVGGRPLFFVDPRGLAEQFGPFRVNAKICCQTVSGLAGITGAKHCSIHVDALGKPWAAFELMPNPREYYSKGFVGLTNDPPEGECVTTGGDCELVKCIRDAYRSYPNGGDYIGGKGPNSNTFVKFVAQRCRLRAPAAAYESKGYYEAPPAWPDTSTAPPPTPPLPACCN
jgi:RHS repeat-associated protein